jgi:hypothetical protein
MDKVLGQFWGDLLLSAIGQVETGVIVKHLSYQTVIGSAHRGEQHQLVTTILIGLQGGQYCIQLAAKSARLMQ